MGRSDLYALTNITHIEDFDAVLSTMAVVLSLFSLFFNPLFSHVALPKGQPRSVSERNSRQTLCVADSHGYQNIDTVDADADTTRDKVSSVLSVLRFGARRQAGKMPVLHPKFAIIANIKYWILAASAFIPCLS